MESVKDYFVEYIRIKQSYTKATKLQLEEVSQLKNQLAYYKRENYALRTKLLQQIKQNPPNDYQQVLINACKICDITMDELKGKARNRHLIVARHICFYILRNDFALSLVEIGRIFNRHHSSIIHAIKNMDFIIENPTFNKYEFRIYQQIKGI